MGKNENVRQMASARYPLGEAFGNWEYTYAQINRQEGFIEGYWAAIEGAMIDAAH